MFVLVVGGGKVGYYLTKELLEAGHEVVLMERDRARASQIADEIGSIVVPSRRGGPRRPAPVAAWTPGTPTTRARPVPRARHGPRSP